MIRKADVAELRTQQIIKATVRCLARDGFSQLTMKRLAAEADVSQGALHYYFKDKRAILAAAAEHVMNDLEAQVAAEVGGARDARLRLRAMIRACLSVATKEREFWTVFMALWSETLHDDTLAAINRKTYRRARHAIAKVIEIGVAEGQFKISDVAATSALVLAVVDGISLQLTFEKKLMAAASAERMCETLLLGYLESGRG
jgi:TetR/AcrR family transcriptional repressor of bet genes